jgi:hypothetical protein
MKPDIIVITPRPPICISTKITICPKTLHDEKVGVTTKPVTHVDVVAVNSASKKGVVSPLAELIGNDNNIAPISIAIRKLNKIICVVDIEINLFFIFLPNIPKTSIYNEINCNYIIIKVNLQRALG